MVSINYSAREVCCKIVYYGPGLSGKTTNLQYIHSKVPGNTRGKLISLATEADRTLYFDFLPLNIGTINDFQAKFQLYTVPGQVYYNATRKLVLRGVDGLVFVADSQPDKMDENIESLANLIENIREYGYDPATLPLVLQYNKQDLPGVLSVEELNAKLNPDGLPTFAASATVGTGVFDTLKLIIKLVLDHAKSGSSAAMISRPSVQTQVPASQPSAYPTVERVPADTSPSVAAAASPALQPVGVMAEAPASPGKPVTGEGAVAASITEARPYPGSHQGTGATPRQIPTGFSGSAGELPADSLSRNVSSPVDEIGGATGGMNSPQMAPSLRRRGGTKKRGFFKRLFGIK